MRIFGPNGPVAPATANATRRTAASSFTLPKEEVAAAPAGTQSLRTVGGIDALIALQGIESTEERRKRAVTRGRTALDALDELKLGLLASTLDQGTLARLKVAASGLKDASGDPALDGVIAEIELRVEVELAKMGTSAMA